MSDTKKLPPCYASQHLHPGEFAVWEVSMRLTSGGKNTLFFDGRSMAKRFSGISKDYVYRAVKKLVMKGWLSPLNGPGRKMNKHTRRYEATQYHVLCHSEWVSVHGSSHCAGRADETGPLGSVRQEPFAESEKTIREPGVTPVAPMRHNLALSSVKDFGEGGFIRTNVPPSLETEVQNQFHIPTREEWARKLLEALEIPDLKANRDIAIAAIATRAKHSSDEEAVASILKAAELARCVRERVTPFWLQDGRWTGWL
jgi:hypothetical protein